MDKKYYTEMLKRDRAFTVFKGDKMKCLITYFIGNGNVNKYVRNNPWSVIDDEPETGDCCYIDQCVSSKEKDNHKYNRIVFNIFIQNIKKKYPKVTKLRWNRFKNGVVNVYKKELS